MLPDYSGTHCCHTSTTVHDVIDVVPVAAIDSASMRCAARCSTTVRLGVAAGPRTA